MVVVKFVRISSKRTLKGFLVNIVKHLIIYSKNVALTVGLLRKRICQGIAHKAH